MSDQFLNEVRKVHEARTLYKSASEQQKQYLAGKLSDRAAGDWIFMARDGQLPPADLNWCWLFMGGRGGGKTHAISCAVHMAVRAGVKRMHFIAPTTADFHEVNVEGKSGILATHGRDPRPRWAPSRRRLEWANGAVCLFFSADEPESLRGPQCEICFVDEIARMRYQQAVFDNAMFGLRLGDMPRMMIATTPKPTKFMKSLVKMEGISITTGSTYDNATHLAPSFLSKIRELYEGTRLGAQELQGAMILTPASALFKDEWIIMDEVAEERIEQASVGVDPSGGGDDVGIVVSALLTDGRMAVLADRTMQGSPAQWGEEVVRAHDQFDCDDVVVEINFGGQMATDVIKQAADRLHERGERDTNLIRVKEVTASRGKVLRAEPISLLMEKGRVLMRRGMDKLVMEMLAFSREWDRERDGSPNRLDAMVWSLTRLSKVITDVPIA